MLQERIDILKQFNYCKLYFEDIELNTEDIDFFFKDIQERFSLDTNKIKKIIIDYDLDYIDNNFEICFEFLNFYQYKNLKKIRDIFAFEIIYKKYSAKYDKINNLNHDLLKLFTKYGCVNKDKNICDSCEKAALVGHLDCLKYLHFSGVSWNIFTCSKATIYGNLECLEYAHENGCPWDIEYLLSCFRCELGKKWYAGSVL